MGIQGHLWLHMELEASQGYMRPYLKTKISQWPKESTSAPMTLGHHVNFMFERENAVEGEDQGGHRGSHSNCHKSESPKLHGHSSPVSWSSSMCA